MLVFLRLINLSLCQIAMQFEWHDAYEAYSECLRTAQGTGGASECYSQLVNAIGEASLEFVSCLF